MDGVSQRYEKQMKLPRFGAVAQERLRASRVLVVGCGALGTAVTEQLCRAGVGTVSIVDRDVVEWSNLQRQTLFTEQDARRGTPKAEAAKARLGQINSEVRVRAFVDDLDASNARSYVSECDLIVDCLDNFESRYILNDCAVESSLPFVYGGAVGFAGMAAGMLPALPMSAETRPRLVTWSDADATPCLRCIAPDVPRPGEAATCDAVGVLGSVSLLTASLEASIAIRLLAEGTDRGAPMAGVLLRFDLGTSDGAFPQLHSSNLRGARDRDCPCCARRVFDHLLLDPARPRKGRARVLCGRNAVEVHLGEPLDVPATDRLEQRLLACGHVQRETVGDTSVLVLVPSGTMRSNSPGSISPRSSAADDRDIVGKLTVIASKAATLAVIDGTTDPEIARGVVARYVGV